MAANEDRQQAGDQVEAAIAERLKLALEKKLEQSRALLQQKEREFGRDVAMLKSALAAAHAARASAVAGFQAATAEQERLQALVAEHEGDRERIAADRQAAVDTLQQSLARTREEAALDIEQSRQALAESRLELAQAFAEQTRIAARVEEQMREQARLAARLEAAERELDLQRAEHERAHDGLIAEHQRALADVQAGKRDELEALERRLQTAAAEHRRLEALVEEGAVDRERIAADHRAAVDTLQQSLARARGDAALQVEQSRQALAESRSALAESLAEQSDIAERVEEQTREQDLIRAEHLRALADMETRHRDALAELRSELAHTAERAARHEHERDRISAEHALAIAGLQAGNEAAAAELRSKLSDALAERHRLTALLEEHDRERERLAAEQRQVVLKDGPALEQPLEAEHERAEDADRLHEPFDDADDAFIHQLLGGAHAKRVPETHTDPKTGGPQQAVSGMPALKTDEPADDIFDAKDATFARRLMETSGPLPRSAEGDS